MGVLYSPEQSGVFAAVGKLIIDHPPGIFTSRAGCVAYVVMTCLLMWSKSDSIYFSILHLDISIA